ncbi:trypsin-like cysteine/serine peptidase domain-containing protein [Bisporella sp. PMI_857]|nr:trypsin-like cysteine/serine peptidase domain-containing protein [Bisporella sp. PMI_857]
MSHHGRVLRSNTPLTTQRVVSLPLAPKASNPRSDTIQTVGLESKLPGTTATELELLREKQKKLAGTASSTLKRLTGKPHISNALEATLIFAQYEAGTAVCIDRAGWVLTCAHCFGDTEEEYKESSKRKWLLFYTGLAVQVECRAWDPKRDLALLKIITVESSQEAIPSFPYVTLAMESPSSKMSIICIGQPGRDDLESTSDRRTKYKLVEISEGTFCGMVEGADFQDNSEIGTLMHDAWTYWGHSGAPLLRESDGTLIGLHSSWDDETAMRHGVPHIAIKEFLEQEAIIPVRYKIEDS